MPIDRYLPHATLATAYEMQSIAKEFYNYDRDFWYWYDNILPVYKDSYESLRIQGIELTLRMFMSMIVPRNDEIEQLKRVRL